MSCIQTSVGLGNIWRFPFTAYENGGGAFLVPYIIVLLIIGKPMYYLEMFMGQFTSSSAIKIWSISPGFRGNIYYSLDVLNHQIFWILDDYLTAITFLGTGAGQVIASISVITYYCSLIALTMHYFFASFSSILPWSQCLPEWGADCVDSMQSINNTTLSNINGIDTTKASSSELYFL